MAAVTVSPGFSRRFGPVIIGVLIAAALLCVALRLYGVYHKEQMMSPYRELVRQHATKQDTMRRFGQPRAVIKNSKELLKWFTRRWKPTPRVPARVESEVLFYIPDPDSLWCEGVYVFIDKRGVVSHVVRATT